MNCVIYAIDVVWCGVIDFVLTIKVFMFVIGSVLWFCFWKVFHDFDEVLILLTYEHFSF